ncbi:hypothetical protein GCM10028801_27980 [Nocardioides maradonensis]
MLAAAFALLATFAPAKGGPTSVLIMRLILVAFAVGMMGMAVYVVLSDRDPEPEVPLPSPDAVVVRRPRKDVYFAIAVVIALSLGVVVMAIWTPWLGSGPALTVPQRWVAGGGGIACAAGGILAGRIWLAESLTIDDVRLVHIVRRRTYVVDRAGLVQAASYIPPDRVPRLALLGESGRPLVILRLGDWEPSLETLIAERWQLRVPYHRDVSRRDMQQLYPTIDWPRLEFTRGNGGP